MKHSRRRSAPPATTRSTTAAATVGFAALVAIATLLAPAGPLSAQGGVAGTSAQSPHAAAIERAMESRTRGAASATVVVFEIADFQCPYCAQFAQTVAPELYERYVATGQVQWVFVNLPLHSHPLAWHAAEAALCAGAAGDQFWPMHDRLFAEQSEWGSLTDPGARFARYAADLGVPGPAFAACTEQDHVAGLILQDVGSAISAGITGTPSFIIMKDQQVVERMAGVQAVEQWVEVLERVVAQGR